MKLLFALCLSALAQPAALAVPQTLVPTELVIVAQADAINALCPIGKEAIDGETFVTYEGHRIGFCCGGCDSKFLAWGKAEKDAFVEQSLAQKEEPGETPESEPQALKPAPYTLTTCPVSGELLGAMGEPLTVEVRGRAVKLCCKGCVKQMESDPDKYLAIVDAAFIAQQKPYYAVTTCVVTDEPLVEDGKDIGVDVVIQNRLFRVCCKGCIKKLEKDSARFGAILDRKLAEAQRAHYPLDHCIVRGEQSKLGSMGDPYDVVVANRLVRLCCEGCLPKLEAEPIKYLALLDEAWAPLHGKHESKADHDGAAGHEHGHH